MLRDFAEKLKLIFLPQTPLIIIMLFFVIGSIYANKLGFKAISRVNLMITIALFISIIVMFAGTLSMMDANRIFPIFGNGIKETFMIEYSNLYAFIGIAYLYFIKPFLSKQENINKIAFIGTIISTIYLFICILTCILVLPTKIILDNSFPIYFISNLASLGSFFSRIESLFVFLWILGVISYISISMFFTLYIWGEISNMKDVKGLRYYLGLIVLWLALIPESFEQNNYLTNIFQFVIVLVVFVLSFGIISLAYLKQRKKKEEINETNS